MRQASSRSKPPADERVPLLGVDFRGQRGLRRWRSGVFDLRQSYMSIIEGLLLGALFGEATDRNRLGAVVQVARSMTAATASSHCIKTFEKVSSTPQSCQWNPSIAK